MRSIRWLLVAGLIGATTYRAYPATPGYGYYYYR